MSITLTDTITIQAEVPEITTNHIKVGEVVISKKDDSGNRAVTVNYETFDGANDTEYQFTITTQAAIQNIIDSIDSYVIAQGWLAGTVD